MPFPRIATAMTHALQHHQALAREQRASGHLPYRRHVEPHVIETEAGHFVQAFRLSGASFESADDETINTWHERLNVLWRNIASDQVSLWSHVIRRRESVYPEGEFPPGFAADLNARYRQRLAGETLMVNELYLSVVYRPSVGAASSLLLQLLNRGPTDHAPQALRAALEACAKLRAQLLAALERYEPECLGIYRNNGRLYSSLMEYVGLLMNGESQPFPLPRAPLNEVLATTRVFFGAETLEYRMATATRFGAFLGIKEYPTPTQPGLFNALLTASFPFVLTQSFTFLNKSTAQALLSRQFQRLRNAQDLAVSQAEQLKEALDQLTSNAFAMGDHHFSLQVLTDPTDARPETPGAPRLKPLLDHLAEARTRLADTGMVVAREDLALEAAFWAQLPGNFPFRVRKSPLTSRNFAGLVPFHNYPAGRRTGNHWGEALTMFVTSARSPYYFSLHASDPKDSEGGSRRDIGHTSVIGPTGSGKTVWVGFSICMLAKTKATQVVFDKDRGLEILIRALGGLYLPLQHGMPTGMNPLQLEPTATNVEFLKTWLRRLVERPEKPLSVLEEADLDQALKGTLALELKSRRLSRVLEFLDPTDPEGMHARLSRWCVSANGDYGWVFDHPEDQLAALLSSASIVGLDVTEFLDNEVTRTPVTLVLFHLVQQLLDGRRLVVWMDEFSKLLSDKSFERFSKNGLETARKRDAVFAFATQSPSHVLQSPIARTLIEQTPTKVFFPNAEAAREDYMDGFGLSEQEFLLIKEGLDTGSRSFLLKQGHHSVVCQLDLKGFDFELDVISGRISQVRRVNELIAKEGSDPQIWLPKYREQRARAAQVPQSNPTGA